MKAVWLIAEIFANIVESAAITYFLNSKFISKKLDIHQQVVLFVVIVLYDTLTLFTSVPFVEVGLFALMILYLAFYKQGALTVKFLYALIAIAILFSTSMVGAGLVGIISGINPPHIIQDDSRLMALIFVKALQIIIFYLLSKRKAYLNSIKRQPVIFGIIGVIDALFCLTAIYIITAIPAWNHGTHMMTIVSVGLFAVIVIIFIVFELFAKEEHEKLELFAKMQRFELESRHYREMSLINNNVRIWQHDYNNHMIVLKGLIEAKELDEALVYISDIGDEINNVTSIVNTGYRALDSLINAKLAVAKAQGIDINLNLSVPENAGISDMDICTIMGNLLDNAIEACAKISNTKHKKFIDVVIETKKKNLAIYVKNSMDGIVLKKSGRFLSTKEEPNHGIGLLRIDEIVEKYNGYLLREYDNNVFLTSIMLPVI